jgi:hypothetical protein
MYKIAKLFIVVAMVHSAFLQGMDASTVADTETKTETPADVAERAKKSGYTFDKRGRYNDRWLDYVYAHVALSEDVRIREWSSVAEGIVAGCKTDPLFADTVTIENLMTVCKELDFILKSDKANECDFTRITAFLNRCIDTEKIKKKDLPAALKQLINNDDASTEPKSKSTILKISIYKIAIPVFAVGVVAVIAYKWWSKKQAEAKKAGVDEADENEITSE